eukprot:CAMPEP_0113943776 /NCGR_PEP_ID=MMETSP1339-20121228/27568_1 /TAXON_ID=94617 /ORGANISM="Fibrocapsa japonica" /LENGTH=114 /DNA_ID=CAMNT_0000948729 /DNA_START=21 /DNA_END=362 /DNA_ORIENTATION=- /assembly_acc=CAM_ASM_000762
MYSSQPREETDGRSHAILNPPPAATISAPEDEARQLQQQEEERARQEEEEKAQQEREAEDALARAWMTEWGYGADLTATRKGPFPSSSNQYPITALGRAVFACSQEGVGKGAAG